MLMFSLRINRGALPYQMKHIFQCLIEYLFNTVIWSVSRGHMATHLPDQPDVNPRSSDPNRKRGDFIFFQLLTFERDS